ncbi:MAG: response regulator transcription factor [Opitutae bacterium]|nr:response regulator transcription factor [Opitutae bacterium]
MKPPIHIALIEDHPEYREVIELALAKEADLVLTDQFGTAEMAFRKIEAHKITQKPDVVLLDLNLPGMSGLDAITWLKKYSPKTKIIILSQSDREADVYQAIQHGASGYLLKSSTIGQIKQGIRSVMQGGSPLDAKVASYILKNLKTTLPKNEQEVTLSDREMETLTLLAKGLSKKEIATEMSISTTTVVTHVGHIYEKLNTVNAPAAVDRAHRLGLFN